MYDKFPTTKISSDSSKVYKDLSIFKDESLVIVETFPGVSDDVLESFKSLGFNKVINTIDLFISEEEMNKWLKPILTKDRVRGRKFFGEIIDFMDEDKIEEAKKDIVNSNKVLVYGFGASLLSDEGVLVFVDVPRWEIQMRYRKGMPNFNASNYDEDNLKKIKRGYFFEWPMANKLKKKVFRKMDYYFDNAIKNNINMISSTDYFKGLKIIANQPFRLVPFFDPGVWGGQWMKEEFNLEENNSNYAWSFDGVPEENSINLGFGKYVIETPAINLVLAYPLDLLGRFVYQRYGAEFPIRFDYLDTVKGQNLSLQVHPPVELIQREFGMAYTQSESYYLMQSFEGGVVYLGVKNDVDKKEMFDDLRKAQEGKIIFDAEKYVNVFPSKKHDHYLIPPGTIHCSGSNTVVLEISTTPNIFTFKLWDWGRLGLDGLPRPTHIDLGEEAINMDNNTDFVNKYLVNQSKIILDDGENLVEETGLTDDQHLVTTRIHVKKSLTLNNNEVVSMMNLVEGDSCVIKTDKIDYEIHYGETFIVPASVDLFTIESKEAVILMRAQVRK